jgi:hypothetical protein
MGNRTRLLFNPIVLDTPNQSLKRGTEKIVFRPKTALWPVAKVVDVALRVSNREIAKC